MSGNLIPTTPPQTGESKAPTPGVFSVVAVAASILVVFPTFITILHAIVVSCFEDKAYRETYGGLVVFTSTIFGGWVAIRWGIHFLGGDPSPVHWVEVMVINGIYVLLILLLVSVTLDFHDRYRAAAWTLGRAHEERTIMLNPEACIPKHDQKSYLKWMIDTGVPIEADLDRGVVTRRRMRPSETER